jgi:hypothetical protein
MWIVELTFTDEPERLAVRAAHRALLTSLHRDGVVRMAGPFAGDTGALIVLELPDREAVDAIISADPYFTTPGVTVTAVREWNPILP